MPLQGVTMDECVTLARRVGAEIWKRHQIPVYFYESAAEAQPGARRNSKMFAGGQFRDAAQPSARATPIALTDVGRRAAASDSRRHRREREEVADRL